ncbi:hypothetical protein BV898_02787 [Hypsibius exemplaris]|uniref:Uncharacterized protein n=1 Tax=Hypsibius exemplaris TaxID=2072580 RepID=A0A1W0X7I5_HYPEX|nr:hypothetical protein BV898_02787 [Hypsibius exemplaris]
MSPEGNPILQQPLGVRLLGSRKLTSGRRPTPIPSRQSSSGEFPRQGGIGSGPGAGKGFHFAGQAQYLVAPASAAVEADTLETVFVLR